MLTCLDHVVVAVESLPSATGRYARLLGRTPSWRGEHPSAGTENTLFRLENTVLELLAPVGEGALAETLSEVLAARGEGPLALAFGTDDAHACRDWLSERGFEPERVERGVGRDVESGAYREWRRVMLPAGRTRGVPLFAIEQLSPQELLPPAGPLVDEASAVFGLDHAVVRSSDPDAALRVYGEPGLGIRLALDREFPQWGARLLFFRIAGATVEIAAALEQTSGDRDTDRDQLWGLSWRVRNADAAHARMKQLGFQVSEVRDGRRRGTRVFSVADAGLPTLMLEPPAAP